MENVTLSIESKKRLPLPRGRRIYSISYGVILILLGLVEPIQISSQLFYPAIIIIGICSLIYGIIGKELYKTRNYFKIDKALITSKKSFEKKKVIDIKTITHIKSVPTGFDLSFDNYGKRLNLSWMTPEEYSMVKLRFDHIAKENNIMTE
jgi:hypothetical protein